MPYKDYEKAKARNRTRYYEVRESRLEKVKAYHKALMEKTFGVKYPEVTVCGVGGERISGDEIVLDHDHKTGKFRGWTCRRHNAVIGQVEKYWVLVFAYLGKKLNGEDR